MIENKVNRPVAPQLSPNFDPDQYLDLVVINDGFRGQVREVVKYRYLLQNLVIRDLKVRYKNSLLGVLWSLLNPLLMMLVFTAVFTIAFSNDSIRHYAVFILVGLLPWNFFKNCLMGSTVSITSNANLIKKVYFPRQLLPIATVLAELINFSLAFLILIALLFAFGIGLTQFALWVPLILLTQITFTLGLAFLLSALHVYYRDVMMILDFGTLAWFFLTPVFYPFEWLGGSVVTLWGITIEPTQIMRWINPMASIIDGYRTVLWGNLNSAGPANMDPIFLLRTLVTALIILVIGYTVFARTQHIFGERL